MFVHVDTITNFNADLTCVKSALSEMPLPHMKQCYHVKEVSAVSRNSFERELAAAQFFFERLPMLLHPRPCFRNVSVVYNYWTCVCQSNLYSYAHNRPIHELLRV